MSENPHPINYSYPSGYEGAPTREGVSLIAIRLDKAFFSAYQQTSGDDFISPEEISNDYLANFIQERKANEILAVPEICIGFNNADEPDITFYNGRHRLASLARMGEETVPAILKSNDIESALSLPFIEEATPQIIQQLESNTSAARMQRAYEQYIREDGQTYDIQQHDAPPNGAVSAGVPRLGKPELGR